MRNEEVSGSQCQHCSAMNVAVVRTHFWDFVSKRTTEREVDTARSNGAIGEKCRLVHGAV